MNTEEKRNYRNAFRLMLVLNCVLLAALAGWWWRSQQRNPEEHPATPPGVTSSSPQAAASANAVPAPEAPMVPVQLTPQRMQSIGVKLGTVQFRQVDGELRVPGTVDADERRIAYVQTRFSGWIRKVYADTTYQYVRKGQPLFTI